MAKMVNMNVMAMHTLKRRGMDCRNVWMRSRILGIVLIERSGRRTRAVRNVLRLS